MKEFIMDKMNTIFGDFQGLIKRESLCDLKDFTFKGRKLPDYSNEKHQQLFLLRYLPAYLCEYKYLYRKVIRQGQLARYNILSVGCGCFLDYHGLSFAAMQASVPTPILYTGIDMIRWEYNDFFYDSNIHFLQTEIENFPFPKNVDYNIIFFPKSLSEISDEGLNVLLENLQKVHFTSDHIYLISSCRDNGFTYDEAKYKEIIDTFRSMGFCCNDYKGTQELTNKGSFFYLDSDFYYPDNIKNYLCELHTKCCKFVEHNDNCDDDCEQLSRFPILTTKHVSFLYNLLERKT